MGCPLIVSVGGSGTGPSVTLPGPGPVHRPSTLLVNHPGRLEDIEVNVEGERFTFLVLAVLHEFGCLLDQKHALLA